MNSFNSHYSVADNTQKEFGSSKEHNRHFVIVSVVLLVAALIVLYLLNSFGYFGSPQIQGLLTEENCLQIFSGYSNVDNIGFSQFTEGNKLVSKANSLDSNTRFSVERSDEGLKCSVKKRSTESLFKSKGLGSSEYKCGDVLVTYSGSSEEQFFVITKETQLPESTVLKVDATNPGSIGIPEFDEKLKQLPERSDVDLELTFGDQKFIQEISYISSKELYENELNLFRNRYCGSFFELVS